MIGPKISFIILFQGNGQWQTSVKPPGSHQQVIDNDENDILIDDEIGIIKQFQFSSDHQSMYVLITCFHESLIFYLYVIVLSKKKCLFSKNNIGIL